MNAKGFYQLHYSTAVRTLLLSFFEGHKSCFKQYNEGQMESFSFSIQCNHFAVYAINHIYPDNNMTLTSDLHTCCFFYISNDLFMVLTSNLQPVVSLISTLTYLCPWPLTVHHSVSLILTCTSIWPWPEIVHPSLSFT